MDEERSAQTVQPFIAVVARGLLLVFAYVDNIIFAFDSEGRHIELIRLLCNLLHEHAIVINTDKCELGVPPTEALGHFVDKQGIKSLRRK